MTLPRQPTVAAARRLSTSGWSTYLWLLAVLCLFCAPLFVGLRGWDLHSDEAIYSYSVDRILETGEWLTPRSMPYDGPFLEKPPLKFWMVAGAMRAGLLPHDEFGFRVIDALFGAIAFVYVFWLGRSLAGPMCGFVAVLVLFTLDSFLFDHGLRSNGMDAALVLSYCGGVYHFWRWVEGTSRRHQSIHAIAVACYFVLGFMTKFVAVLLLPLVCAMAVAWRDDALIRLRSSWRDWVLPVFLALGLTTPWFIYQAGHTGSALWQTMFNQHVYTRFTGVLDPGHLQPWHYYFSRLWAEMILANSQWISILGLLMLGAKTWSGRPWLARLLFLWLIVPFGLISVGTSKIFHYAYPFLPPIALGAGMAAAVLIRAIEHGIALSTSAAVGKLHRAIEGSLIAKPAGWIRWLRRFTVEPFRSRAWVRQLLVAGAVFAVALSVWTALVGRVRLEVNGVELLRNSSVSRPIFLAAVLFILAGHARMVNRVLAVAAVALILPVLAYRVEGRRLTSVDHPFRTLRDCAVIVHESRPVTHVYPSYGRLLNHTYFHYLRGVGPWVEHDRSPKNDELLLRLYAPSQQTLVVLSKDDYEAFIRQVSLGQVEAVPTPFGLALSEHIVLLTPGPFEACAIDAIAAGGRAIGNLPLRGTRQ